MPLDLSAYRAKKQRGVLWRRTYGPIAIYEDHTATGERCPYCKVNFCFDCPDPLLHLAEHASLVFPAYHESTVGLSKPSDAVEGLLDLTSAGYFFSTFAISPSRPDTLKVKIEEVHPNSPGDHLSKEDRVPNTLIAQFIVRIGSLGFKTRQFKLHIDPDLPAMPYNNTAIPPSDEVTGQVSLPLARVKKILQADDEIAPVSQNAAFVITLATEMFIRYFSEQAHNQARTDTRPRRSIQYKDLANAVARLDNLEFLSDLVPRTTTWREYQLKKARETGEVVSRRERGLLAGQTTLDGTRPHPASMSDQVHSQDVMLDDDDTVADEEHTNGPVMTQPPNNGVQTNGNGTLRFVPYAPNGRSARDATEDSDMAS
ncbi:hypothetical protein MMC30_008110 [Trapelia coarctata]|nr:hypothetical protein [Trapelia coarctata]